MMWCILLAVVAVVVTYWRLSRPYKYWVERGVKQGKPHFLVGDNLGTILKKQSLAEMVQMVYNRFPNNRYSGCYQFLAPILLLRDPDLIKEITVKDFDHFVDHRTFLPEDIDPLWSNNLFALTGKKWKKIRTTLSPAFTSSKTKYMFSLITQTGEQFVKHFLNKNEDLIIHDTFNDVIANTAFGIECNSLNDAENEFYLMGKEATNLTGFWTTVKIFGYLLVPQIFKHFDLRFFSAKISMFFTKLVKSNIKSREKHKIIRPDMIQLLLEARKYGFKHEESQMKDNAGFAEVEESSFGKFKNDSNLEITDLDITSQALSFFFAGFDSVSSLLSFMSYELGLNPDIQERLIQEVDETMEACKGKLTYEAIVTMKYMDMVVSETLRKWPNTVAVDRVCTKPYTIEPKTPDEKPLYLEKGAILWLPIFALHRDPQYYPEPDRFDPERFSEENKRHIRSYSYLPFGSGPRNCIGSRLALLETKILFCYLLSDFEIVPVEKTAIPLVISKKLFNLSAEGGLWLGLKRRKTFFKFL